MGVPGSDRPDGRRCGSTNRPSQPQLSVCEGLDSGWSEPCWSRGHWKTVPGRLPCFRYRIAPFGSSSHSGGRRLARVSHPMDATSPTTHLRVMVSGRPGNIFVLAADGSQEAAIVQHPSNNHSTIWSPDGSQVLFVSDRTATPSLWSVPVKDGKAAGEAELVKSDIGAHYAVDDDAYRNALLFRSRKRPPERLSRRY